VPLHELHLAKPRPLQMLQRKLPFTPVPLHDVQVNGPFPDPLQLGQTRSARGSFDADVDDGRVGTVSLLNVEGHRTASAHTREPDQLLTYGTPRSTSLW
jgi:hypothetical protein